MTLSTTDFLPTVNLSLCGRAIHVVNGPFLVDLDCPDTAVAIGAGLLLPRLPDGSFAQPVSTGGCGCGGR